MSCAVNRSQAYRVKVLVKPTLYLLVGKVVLANRFKPPSWYNVYPLYNELEMPVQMVILQ